MGGLHVWEPICHVWIRSALPRLKISNKEALLVPADAAQRPGDSFTGKGPCPRAAEMSREEVERAVETFLPSLNQPCVGRLSGRELLL